ncbi:unnamed protein product [Agarophyton chilense]
MILPPDRNAVLNRESVRKLFHILRVASLPIFPDMVVMLCLPLMILAYMVGGYFVILAPGKLYNTLVSEDWPLFRSEMTKYALIATAVLLVKVLRGVLRESSANYLRLRITDAIHSLYFANRTHANKYGPPAYYKLIAEDVIDNPDQRIVADARDFSVSLLDILAGGRSQGQDTGGCLEAVASLLLYSNKTLIRTGWFGIIVAYLWSALVSLGTVYAINCTSPVVFRQEKLEADFRYRHAEFRRHFEEIAMLRGGPLERERLSSNLDMAVSNTWTVISRHVFLNFVQYGFGYYVSLIMYLALALAIYSNVFDSSSVAFSSDMTPGEKAQWISQTGSIFMQLLYSFTMLVQLGTVASEFISHVNRLAALVSVLEEEPMPQLSTVESPDTEPLMSRTSHDSNHSPSSTTDSIQVEELVVQPGGSTIVGPISFTLEKGRWVLLDGRTGTGKTSIVKVLRGIWTPSSGMIRMPQDQTSVIFVPQTPYITSGFCSLRELVTYPKRCCGSIEETNRVSTALEEVGWCRGLHGECLDLKTDWSCQISPGEAQLIAASRVLFHRPSFVILDEPTASLDVVSEARVMTALKRGGISSLTVAHSPSLRQLHDQIVTLGVSGL